MGREASGQTKQLRRDEDRRAEEAAGRIVNLKSARVAVLGDIMVDRFIWGQVSRISPEAPVPVVEVDRSREADGHRLGGAANVAHNLVRLGASATLFGVVGDDEANRLFRRMLEVEGIEGEGVRVVPGRATTLKTRVVAQGQQVVRFDVEERTPLPEDVVRALYAATLESADRFDVVIVSDYAKGVINPTLLTGLIAALRQRGKWVVVDPKVANLAAYRGAHMVTPNRLEAFQSTGIALDGPEAVERAGNRLLEMLGCDGVLLTLGEDGMALIRANKPMFAVPARAAEVFDVTGAGDTVIAVLALALAAQIGMEGAVQLANLAAGIVVGKVGTAVVAPHELEAAMARERGALCL